MDCRPADGGPPTTLLIACGALAREVVEVIRLNGLSHVSVTCLPAIWHNTPDKIPEGVRRKIHEARGKFDRVLVLYGDCGSGGLLAETNLSINDVLESRVLYYRDAESRVNATTLEDRDNDAWVDAGRTTTAYACPSRR